jgi:hypothetical protein
MMSANYIKVLLNFIRIFTAFVGSKSNRRGLQQKMTETISIKLGKTMKEELRALAETATRCRATSPLC